MEVDSEPSTQCNASRIFEGYKALGLIAGDKPFIVRYIDKFEDVRIVIIVGNYFHTYNSKLQLIETSHPHPGPVNALASDSKSVFSCSENKIYAWSGGRRNLYQVFEGHESRIHSLLAFGPHLISVDDSNVFRVWEISTAETVLEVPFGEGFTITCLLHPSTYINKILLGSKQGSLQLRNIRTQKLIHTFKGWNSKVTAIEQAPAVDVVGIGLEDGVIVVHNLKYDETLMTFIQDWGPVLNISFRTDGPPHMVTSSDKGHVAIWDLEKRKLFVQKRDIHQAKVTGCQYIFGEALLLTSSPDNSLKMWCFDDPEEIGRTLHCREGHTHPSTFIRFYGSEGQNILSVSSDSTFRMFSVYSERLHRSLGKASFNRKYAKKVGVANDPNVMPPIVDFAAESIREDDWDNVIARHAGLARVTTWTTKKMRMGSHKLLHERFKNTKDIVCTALAISSCGNFVILGYNTGHIDRFNIQSGIFRASYAKINEKAHEGSVSGIVCDETCRLLVSGGKDGIINFWVFKTCELLTELKVDIPINRFMLHKESSILAVAFDDHTIQVIDLDTRKCIRKLPDHKTPITDMTISYDARWLIVSTEDCSIRVWDISLIKLIDWFLMPSPCKSLTMSPTGDYLAIALENDLGIFLYFNLSLYLPVSLKPISDSHIPRLNKLPSVRKEEPEGKEDDDKDQDEADEVVNVEENETVDIDMLDLDYKSPEQISSNLITLSSLPTSRWKNLLNLDLIKQRNKPVEPVEKPKSAPFFLPTIDGLEPDFDLTQTETDDQDKKEKSKVLNNLLGVSPFGKLLLNCAQRNNFSPVIKQLKEMSPNTIDSEIRALDAMTLKDEDIESDDHTLLASFLMAMESALETRKDYELIQSLLGLFLKIYSPIILKDHNLVKQCENLCELVKKLPNSLQDQFNESLFIINFIRGTV
ncbi:WD repeat-containing protein 36-like isoform X2 [Tetranychus urticae]|uniref:Uncharacterized protein n=1 Tax=Tetranychus urticae TaxID=32264 RepID=T1KD97_TETUR|nr:WD repeat-containing protein 36-like isoform X2 [Tetranychus urticae]